MDVQDEMVNEGLMICGELLRGLMASKFHHPHHQHSHHLHAAEHTHGPGGWGERAVELGEPPPGDWRGPEDIPEAQVKLVVHLALHGPQTMSEVAEGLEVTTPAITGLVDKLEKRGLVERVRDSQDRRVVRVRLSPHAQRMAEAHLAERRRQIRDVLATLTPEEQCTFLKTLRLLAQTFRSRQEAESLRKER
jgi:DNA-binding MarR family transcriptional regulator